MKLLRSQITSLPGAIIKCHQLFLIFFWWCYCLIKTHQSIQSIHRNLLSFHCVLHTKFRAESTETMYDTVTSFKEFKVWEQWRLWGKLSCAGLN